MSFLKPKRVPDAIKNAVLALRHEQLSRTFINGSEQFKIAADELERSQGIPVGSIHQPPRGKGKVLK